MAFLSTAPEGAVLRPHAPVRGSQLRETDDDSICDDAWLVEEPATRPALGATPPPPPVRARPSSLPPPIGGPRPSSLPPPARARASSLPPPARAGWRTHAVPPPAPRRPVAGVAPPRSSAPPPCDEELAATLVPHSWAPPSFDDLVTPPTIPPPPRMPSSARPSCDPGAFAASGVYDSVAPAVPPAVPSSETSAPHALSVPGGAPPRSVLTFVGGLLAGIAVFCALAFGVQTWSGADAAPVVVQTAAPGAEPESTPRPVVALPAGEARAVLADAGDAVAPQPLPVAAHPAKPAGRASHALGVHSPGGSPALDAKPSSSAGAAPADAGAASAGAGAASAGASAALADASAADAGARPPAAFAEDAAKAAASAAAAQASGCGDGALRGSARVTLTFAPSGRVTQALLDASSALAGTPVGSCIVGAMRSAQVPPFDGEPVTVQRTVTVR
ncbi:MAG: hypothetical protein IT373_10080 [Polyangiaceae bacterium]|nr:hypothetical protein [Polyangiaceae bacterium]